MTSPDTFSVHDHDTDLVTSVLADSFTVRRGAIGDDLDRLERLIDDLPMLPQVLMRILEMDTDSADYFKHVEQLASEDPAVSVRVIAIANSASSAPAAPVTSIEGALSRMGTAAVNAMLVTLALSRVFTPTKPHERQLWSHSIAVAITSRELANLLPSLKVDPGTAYLCGLLHDIGRFIMFDHCSEEMLAVDESRWRTADELEIADIEIFKFVHSQLGHLACRHWGLPQILADVVHIHHDPVPVSLKPSSAGAAAFCVNFADELCLHLVEREDEQFAELDLSQGVADCYPVGSPPDELVQAIARRIERIRNESAELVAHLGL